MAVVSETAYPWVRFYGSVPRSLSYPASSLYELLARTATLQPYAIAWDFLGVRTTYQTFLELVDTCANALNARGLAKGDRILIALPTSPQAVITLYAANKLGAVPAFVSPLSTTPEMRSYVTKTAARMAVVLDRFHDRVTFARLEGRISHVIVASIYDFMPLHERVATWLARDRRVRRIPADPHVERWNALLHTSHPIAGRALVSTDDPAVILFSGGTTGTPKAILLSNHNLIAEGMQVAAWGGMANGDVILAIPPVFHGFGLSVCVNAAFMAGATSILVPAFSASVVAKLIRTKRPSIMVGVPTLYEALTHERALEHVDLSCLRVCFSGADPLPLRIKREFEDLVNRHGGKVRLLEGYGLTEAVTGVIAMPTQEDRPGSIGVPFPDMSASICRPGTDEELPVGQEGEICLSGPDLMIGYLDDLQATRAALRTRPDGRRWLHTGDLGKMDADGFFYFTERIKRLIKPSGFSVYPAQVEAVLQRHPNVLHACVVGVPDPVQMERVKAFVVLRDRSSATAHSKQVLIDHCRAHLNPRACPREIEFRTEFPTTAVGKVDYGKLTEEPIARAHAVSGGDHVAAALQANGVRTLFTLCGGHISPILTSTKASGISVIDVRQEATAVFAATAVALRSGRPGAAAVTAGPGVTNCITALKNAQLAQSPIVLIGGAAPTALRGRGALQDIDQRSVVSTCVKNFTRVRRVADLQADVENSFRRAAQSVSGPVFLECAIDLLYPEALVRRWYADMLPRQITSAAAWVIRLYLKHHLNGLFSRRRSLPSLLAHGRATELQKVSRSRVAAAANALARAKRPVLVIGSQAVRDASRVPQIAEAVARLGVPTYLSGMARGLLGRQHDLEMRHERRQALSEADCVVLGGACCDFRLNYGHDIARHATLISANSDVGDARLNRVPSIAAIGDVGQFLITLSEQAEVSPAQIAEWQARLRSRDEAEETRIREWHPPEGAFVDPVAALREIESAASERAIFVADGGDLVGTAAHIVRPRSPLGWFDPGPFGTLGVGAGFALGAASCRPDAEVWIIYGDGACGYSLIELDTFVRHRIPVIAIVGNDAAWNQIRREQKKLLGDDVGTVLTHCRYDEVATALGACGMLVSSESELPGALARAQDIARAGRPVLVNVLLRDSNFRAKSTAV